MVAYLSKILGGLNDCGLKHGVITEKKITATGFGNIGLCADSGNKRRKLEVKAT